MSRIIAKIPSDKLEGVKSAIRKLNIPNLGINPVSNRYAIGKDEPLSQEEKDAIEKILRDTEGVELIPIQS